MQVITQAYINEKDKALVETFVHSKGVKKYILGINKFTKQVQKYVTVDGIIDDFTRIQSSRKKSVLHIDDVPKDVLILSTSSGSPLEVITGLNERGFKHFNYLAFYRYSNFELRAPDFMGDFHEDYKNNQQSYEKTYELLADKKSKEVFCKLLNFKISFDLQFMEGFSNNHSEQYFDKEIIPSINNIRFVDGGAYVGDTVEEIIKHFPDYENICCIEPNELHINIAKREFAHMKNIDFIHCGLGKEKISHNENSGLNQNNCAHDYKALNINTLDNLIDSRVDYIKLDIEGAEQDALMGAQQTIQKYHPILAICIYHKAQDWYKVPQLVLGFEKNYDVYVRHYMESIYETVMYFIPKSKAV